MAEKPPAVPMPDVQREGEARVTVESLRVALQAGVEAAQELAAKLLNVFDLPDDGEGTRFK
ncbi:MAG TPA: hypothetical protein VFR85_19035 [Anaeromyxobacteraceae bacterium]|nr:hypothetical protein [Anaeromyxobacteraceae bacterium]